MCCWGKKCLSSKLFQTPWNMYPFVFAMCYFFKHWLLARRQWNVRVTSLLQSPCQLWLNLGGWITGLDVSNDRWKWGWVETEISRVKVGWGRRALMWLQPLLGSEHSVCTTAEGFKDRAKEQHEGVSGPCTMTKSQRARGWKPRELRSQVKKRKRVKKLKEFKLGRGLVVC